MARFGIHPRTTVLGVPMGALQRLGREIGTDHGLALQLWRSGIHEARILATIVDDPARVTVSQAERWVRRLDSWVRFRD
jgi:3-methyladenine DNA glycosylase AlkD